jgi:hypothetical protein
MADPVQLTDLDVITRYSIAVRKATADRDELIETLRSDLSWLERGLRRTRPVEAEPEDATEDLTDVIAHEPAEPAPRRTPIRRMPVKVTPSRRTAKQTATTPAAKKIAAKKAAPRRTR